jgi:chromosome segregation ATPase
VKADFDVKVSELQAAEEDFRKKEAAISSSYMSDKEIYRIIQRRLNVLSDQYEKLKSLEAIDLAAQNRANATIMALRSRVDDGRRDVDVHQRTISEFKSKIQYLEDENEKFLRQEIVLGQLYYVLGPQGIQHYLFTGDNISSCSFFNKNVS